MVIIPPWLSAQTSDEDLASSNSTSSGSDRSGSPSVRTPTLDVNHPTRDSHDSPSMRAEEDQNATISSAKGKEKINITDEDFARSMFAEDALTQFEEYLRGMSLWGYERSDRKDRMLEEFLEEQAFVNNDIADNLAATLRQLQEKNIRRRSSSASEEERASDTVSFPPLIPMTMPTVIPRWSRSTERDDQPVCVVCRCHIAEGKLVRLDCGTKYDIDCLKQMFEANVNDEYHFPPRCCGQAVPLKHVEHQLPRETVDLYKAKMEEYSTPWRLYCSNAQCGRFLGARKESAGPVSCGACGVETCALCTAPYHPTSKCKADKNVRKALQLGQSNGWQRCPRCRQLVERYDGCQHISCRCGMQFCYLCAGNWGQCKCWKKRFFVKALIMKWLHLRGNYLVKDEPAAKNGENAVTRICKRSWKGVRKAVASTPVASTSTAASAM